MTDVWAPLQYGWGHLYWLTIEGVPVAFSQATSSKTAPTDFPTEDPTLVLADSARVGAVVDRDRGVAAGFRSRSGCSTRPRSPATWSGRRRRPT